MIHNAQTSIQAVVYRVVEQVVIDLLRNEFMEEMMEANIARFLGNDASAEVLSERSQALSSFMTRIAIFVGRKVNPAMEDERHSTSFSPKELKDTAQMFTHHKNSSSDCSYSETD